MNYSETLRYVLVVGVTLLPIIAVWYVARRILRRLEATEWAFRRARRATLERAWKPGHAAPVIVVMAGGLLTVPLPLYCRELSSNGELAAMLVIAAAILAVAALHHLPGTRRSTKYALVIGAIMIWWLHIIMKLILSQELEAKILDGYNHDLLQICTGKMFSSKYVDDPFKGTGSDLFAGNMFPDSYVSLVHVGKTLDDQSSWVGRQLLWWDGCGWWPVLIPLLFNLAFASLYAVIAAKIRYGARCEPLPVR